MAIDTIEKAIYAGLKAHAGLSVLVSTRIFPVKRPQTGTLATLPAVTFFQVSGERIHSHNGATGLVHPRWQVSCWGSTYLATKAVAAQVRDALDAYSGSLGSGTVDVGVSLLENEIDLGFDEDRTIYQTALDFMMFHDE